MIQITVQAAQPTSSEAMFDQRLFNQSAGMATLSSAAMFSHVFTDSDKIIRSNDYVEGFR